MLVSGGGIAGSTLAFWLARNGFTVTVVEKAAGTRSSGAPVDVRGEALDVAEGMGLVPELRELATRTDRMTVLNRSGRRVGSLRLPTNDANGVEIPRGDLAAVLARAAVDTGAVEYLNGDHITAITQDDGGADVTFAAHPPRRFGHVIGADGLHSGVRRLVFGPERDYVHGLGLFVATTALPDEDPDPREVLIHNTPGRALSVHPSRGRALAAFIFRGDTTAHDHRDTAAHRRLVRDSYADAGWRAPELAARAAEAEDLYLDAVARVVTPTWSRGRVALVGDAASCVSLFGDGSSTAMVGAHTLAEELARGGDALARYESRHRVRTEAKQRGVGLASGLIVPGSGAALAVRNLGVRAVSLVRRPRTLSA
ncbi:oxidoreductase [Actinorhabdospora filicis]|uniref:Oxidoreductase n=1 Tax=Actinorhabdospora filicis TaxID=1785913 RepID=A0A9W6WCG2_9ACTN|nr:oxidoreductase [Actinorhabdospora filicis]